MHSTVRYRPTGENRDSYISGVRPSGKYGAIHDVSKRRDNLPDIVYNTLREQVLREERMRLVEEEARARTLLELASGKGGKKVVGGTVDDGKRLVEELERTAQITERQNALAELYAREAGEWEGVLRDMHLAPRLA